MPRRFKRGLPLVLALLCLSFPLKGTGREIPQGPEIRSITFQVASPFLISYEEMAGLIPLRTGQRLTDEAVRDSIRGLYTKSAFREVAAFARVTDGKADLVFFLRPSPVVSDIEVHGQKEVPSAQIVAASRIRKGGMLGERDFSDGEAAILEALRKKGFTSAAVSISSLCSVENGSGKVRIDVREGRPADVGRITFPGAAFLSPEALSEMAGARVGEPFRHRKWEAGIGKIRTAYKRAGFLTVRVSDQVVTCEGGGDLCLSVAVEEGTRYAVRWEGNKEFPVSKLEAASGIFGEEETTESGLVHDLRDRLITWYRDRDFHNVQVDVTAGESVEGRRALAISLKEGVKGHISEILFRGNAGIRDKDLRGQMTTEERGIFHFITGSGKYREEDWASDQDAIVGLYQKEGYVRARIASVDTEWNEKGGIRKTIRIEEGPRYTLENVAFHGSDHFLRQELYALMENREGKVVDYGGLERDQGGIAEHYRNAGYLDVRVEAGLDFNEGEKAVSVRFGIEEGPRYRLGKVVVQGNTLTDPVVVLREVPVRAGTPIGESDLLKFQQSVFGTGLYKSVRIHRVKHAEEGIVDLVVEVEETLFFEIEFGGGYGTDTGVRGFVEAKHRNLDGKGRRLTGRVSMSGKEQMYVWDLREPWILGNRWKWEGGLTGLHQDAVRESFSLRKTSLVTSINQTIFQRSSVSLQYELSRDHVYDVKPGAVLSPEDQGGADIAALRVLFVLDFRDDPFNPKKGSLNSGVAEMASLFFGSEVDYLKLAGQSSWYFPLFRRNTLALSGRAGYIRPMRDTVEVPIQKRFFLGGRTTVRGFREDSLGPKGPDGAPIGGDYMVNGNAEIRVPVHYGFIVAGFLDAGSVWFQGDPVNGFDLRKSAGLGLRYVTPVGPISLDYGWKLDKREGETSAEWHFTIGAVF